MAIARIRIENFRSIAYCEFKPSSLCVLVGENNAGKSKILHALARVLARDWVTVDRFTEDDFRGRDTSQPIVIEVEFDPPLTYQRFTYGPAAEIPVLRFTVQRYKKATPKAKVGDLRLEQSCLRTDGKSVSVAPRAGGGKGIITERTARRGHPR